MVSAGSTSGLTSKPPSLVPQVVVRYTVNGGMGGTVTLTAPTIAAAIAAESETRQSAFALTSGVRITYVVPDVQLPKLADRRLGMNTVVTMPEPIISRGRALLPKYLASVATEADATTGVGHIRAFDDPDPQWNGSGWDVPPPPMPAGSQWIRWTARALPDPAASGGEYYLGTRSANDDTLSAPVGEWSAAPGSDFTLPWQSAYPFKPLVRQHLHYGRDNSCKIETAGVSFNSSHVMHMWADFGTWLTPPFSLIVVAVITHAHAKEYSWVMDSGQDPTGVLTESQRQKVLKHGWSGQKRLSENFGYRNALRVDKERFSSFNDQAGVKIARVPWVHQYKPKMMFVVVNGAKSLIGAMAPAGNHVRSAHFGNYGAQRLAVLGRREGFLATNKASNMVVFEIRAVTDAMSIDQLRAHYDQLATTWRFHDYR